MNEENISIVGHSPNYVCTITNHNKQHGIERLNVLHSNNCGSSNKTSLKALQSEREP